MPIRHSVSRRQSAASVSTVFATHSPPAVDFLSMSIDVVMPQMGESIAEGTVSKWLKKVGDDVKRDEAILEISTDKVDAEIPSPAAGVLVEIKVEQGQTVPIQTVIAIIETEKSAAYISSTDGRKRISTPACRQNSSSTCSGRGYFS